MIKSICSVSGIVLAMAGAGQATDITGARFGSANPDCAAYAGTYTSTARDKAGRQTLKGQVTISANGNTCTIRTNQVPNHDVGSGARWRGRMAAISDTLTISRNPSKASRPSALAMGANAIMLNGVKWEAYPAACFSTGRGQQLGRERIGCHARDIDHPWRYDIGSSLNKFGFDSNKAHLQPQGLYHYHSTPVAFYRKRCTGGPEVIGFASDGFPVYDGCFADASGNLRHAVSSYQLKSGKRQQVGSYRTPYRVGDVKSNNYDGQFIGDYQYVAGSGDLDQCNGMTINGQYGYFATSGYPYVLACVTGKPSRSFD